MADNFAQFYSGNMAPPLRLPDGSYTPAPSFTPQQAIEDLYQGIYGPASTSALETRTAKSVPINPATGMPYATTASGNAGAGLGYGYQANGQVRYSQPVYQPNGTIVANKDQSRLPSVPAGLPLNSDTTGYGNARGQLGAGGFSSGSVTAVPRVPSAPVHNLNYEPTEAEGQDIADSMGIAVSTPGRKTYQPKYAGSAVMPSGKVAQRFGGAGQAQPQTRQGGLLGALFGGGGGGLFGGMLGNGGVPRAPRTQAVANPTSGPAIYTPAGNVHPGSFYDNSGNDMAFMPQSYQDNPRNSNGGY